MFCALSETRSQTLPRIPYSLMMSTSFSPIYIPRENRRTDNWPHAKRREKTIWNTMRRGGITCYSWISNSICRRLSQFLTFHSDLAASFPFLSISLAMAGVPGALTEMLGEQLSWGGWCGGAESEDVWDLEDDSLIRFLELLSEDHPDLLPDPDPDIWNIDIKRMCAEIKINDIICHLFPITNNHHHHSSLWSICWGWSRRRIPRDGVNIEQIKPFNANDVDDNTTITTIDPRY